MTKWRSKVEVPVVKEEVDLLQIKEEVAVRDLGKEEVAHHQDIQITEVPIQAKETQVDPVGQEDQEEAAVLDQGKEEVAHHQDTQITEVPIQVKEIPVDPVDQEDQEEDLVDPVVQVVQEDPADLVDLAIQA